MMVKHLVFLSVALIMMLRSAIALELPSPPLDDIFVCDFASVLNASDREEILNLGKALNQEGKAQLALVTVTSMDGYEIDEYANELFRSWGIGVKGMDNGVLVLFAKTERRIRIETGYGLEGALTDGICGQIIRAHLDDLKNDRFSEALKGIYKDLYTKIQNDETIERAEPDNADEVSTAAAFIIFLLMFALIFYLNKKGYIKSGSSGHTGGFYPHSTGSKTPPVRPKDRFRGGSSGGGGAGSSF